MKMGKFLPILVLSLISATAFSMSPKIESFEVANYSSSEVIINVEFWEGEGNYRWSQTLRGVMLTVTDFTSMVNRNILAPSNDSLEIINYYSLSASETILRIPFIEKMNAIFKKLEIICDDGNRVITLENLGEQIVKRLGEQIVKRTAVGGGETAYILEIFDYDYLEARQASEW